MKKQLRRFLVYVGTAAIISACGSSSEDACECLKKAANDYMLKGQKPNHVDLGIYCKELAGEVTENKKNEAKISVCIDEVDKNIESKVLFAINGEIPKWPEINFSVDTFVRLQQLSEEDMRYYYKNTIVTFNVTYSGNDNKGKSRFTILKEKDGTIDTWGLGMHIYAKINEADIKKFGNEEIIGKEGLFDVLNGKCLINGNPYENKAINGYQTAISMLKHYKENNIEEVKSYYSELININPMLAKRIYYGEVQLIEATLGASDIFFNQIKLKAKVTGKMDFGLIEIENPEVLEIKQIDSHVPKKIAPLKVDFESDYGIESAEY